MASELVLYGNTPLSSPYVMSVFVALEEKGLAFEFRQISLKRQENLAQDYVARSVTNRVPTLVHDGFALSESSAITEYLEERFGPPEYPRLYPGDPQQRAIVRMVQALLRSDFMPIREERSTDTVFNAEPPQPLSVVAQEAVDRLFRIASQLLPTGRNSIATDFSIADVDLSMMLQRLLANGDPMPAGLAAYARSVWQRPSVLKWLALTNYTGPRGATKA